MTLSREQCVAHLQEAVQQVVEVSDDVSIRAALANAHPFIELRRVRETIGTLFLYRELSKGVLWIMGIASSSP